MDKPQKAGFGSAVLLVFSILIRYTKINGTFVMFFKELRRIEWQTEKMTGVHGRLVEACL